METIREQTMNKDLGKESKIGIMCVQCDFFIAVQTSMPAILQGYAQKSITR